MLPLLPLLALLAAPPPATAPPLRFELVSSRWLTEEVLTVTYELTNASPGSIELAQHPGPSVAVTCATREGGFRGGSPGGAGSECGQPDVRDRIALAPGRALIGQLAVRVPPECGESIQVLGVYQSAHVGAAPGVRSEARAEPLRLVRAPSS